MKRHKPFHAGVRILIMLTLLTLTADDSLKAADASAGDERPSPGRVPAWAQTGRFRYARWDGGILDVTKGFLSGWPGWREPDQLLAVAQWYEPRNVELVQMAGVNWIWVTFSNGFSLESERPHQERLKQFIAACHRRGIHATAYMSIANIFPDDMFTREPRSREWLAQGKDGKPIPYGAADYSKFTTITRYLACLEHPEWRAYLKERVRRAIAAGCEGIMWDNALLVRCYCPRCETNFAKWREQQGAPEDTRAWRAYYGEMLGALVIELHAAAQQLRPEFLMYVNANRGLYCINRAGNAVSTEDGTEPGLDAQGRVVSNIGALRYQWAVGEGWRPVRVEYGGRLRRGVFESRYTIPMTPRSHQLAAAEAAAHHVGFELYSQGQFQRDLFLRRPEALANLKALGAYNAFLERRESFYVEPRSLARVALLAGDDDRQVAISHELANRGVLFDVLFASSLQPEQLEPYEVLIAPGVTSLSARSLALLLQRIERGARLVISGPFGTYDEHFQPRERSYLSECFGLADEPPPAAGANLPRGNGFLTYRGDTMDWERLIPLLARWEPPLVELDGSPHIRWNLHAQAGNPRWLLHLLNYAPDPAKNIRVRLAAPAAKVALFSPDHVPAGNLKVTRLEKRTEFTVPVLDIYSLLVIQQGS
jgi:hypothetical protein